MAEGIARKMATERGLTGVTFASAGTSAHEGAATSDGAILIGVERGFDLTKHRARLFDKKLISDDTVVLALTTAHLNSVQSIAPDADAHLLDEYASRGATQRNVTDPFGGDLSEYRVAADMIESMIAGVLDRLATDRASRP